MTLLPCAYPLELKSTELLLLIQTVLATMQAKRFALTCKLKTIESVWIQFCVMFSCLLRLICERSILVTHIGDLKVFREPIRILLFMMDQIVIRNIIVPYPCMEILEGVSQRRKILKKSMIGMLNGPSKAIVVVKISPLYQSHCFSGYVHLTVTTFSLWCLEVLTFCNAYKIV